MIAIGVPVAPDHQADTRTVCMIEAWTRDQSSCTFYEPSPSPEEGRDKIVEKARYMKPLPTHILFVDSDVIPRATTLEKLVAHDKDIIAGVVPICQQGEIKWNASRFGEQEFVPADTHLGRNLFKAEYVGFGIVLIKMEVFDKMDWPYWRSLYKPGQRTLGEDLYFCYEARKAGYDIWVDPTIKCDHATRVSYLSILRKLKGNSQ
jgi:GT2 family glycosyltransferase